MSRLRRTFAALLLCLLSGGVLSVGTTVLAGAPAASASSVVIPPADATGWLPLAGQSGVGEVSCLSASSCFGVGVDGTIYTYGGGLSMSASATLPYAGSGAPVAISCVPGGDFCMVIYSDGSAYTYTSATGWTATAQAQTNASTYFDLSCTSASFCMTLNSNARSAVWNGSTWATPVSDSDTAAGARLSCASATFCLVTNPGGTLEQWNGTSWSGTTLADQSLVSCTSASFCMTEGGGTFNTWNGTSWSVAATGILTQTPLEMACSSSSFCLAEDASGSVAYANGTWTANVVPISDNYINALWDPQYVTGLACPADGTCYSVITVAAGEGLVKYEQPPQLMTTPAALPASEPFAITLTPSSATDTIALSGVPAWAHFNAAGDVLSGVAPASGSANITATVTDTSSTSTSVTVPLATTSDSGYLVTSAGNGGAAVGNGIPATELNLTGAVAGVTDAQGNRYVVDGGDNEVLYIPATNCSSSCAFGFSSLVAGDAYVIAGGGASGFNNPATSVQLSNITDLAVNSFGLWISTKTAVAFMPFAANEAMYAVTSTPMADYLYQIAGGGGTGFYAGMSPLVVHLADVTGIAVDASGDLLIADAGTHYAYYLASLATGAIPTYGQSITPGMLYEVAGTGSTGTATSGTQGVITPLTGPTGVAFDGQGNAYVASGTQALELANVSSTSFGQSMVYGNAYVVASGLNALTGIAVDPFGDLYLLDNGAGEVVLVTPSTEARYGQTIAADTPTVIAGGGTNTLGATIPGIGAKLDIQSTTLSYAPFSGALMIGNEGISPLVELLGGEAASVPTLSGSSVTCYIGAACTAAITASGAPTPVVTDSYISLPAWMTLTASGATLSVSGQPASTDAGTFTMTVTATNDVGSVSETLTVNVTNPPPAGGGGGMPAPGQSPTPAPAPSSTSPSASSPSTAKPTVLIPPSYLVSSQSKAASVSAGADTSLALQGTGKTTALLDAPAGSLPVGTQVGLAEGNAQTTASLPHPDGAKPLTSYLVTWSTSSETTPRASSTVTVTLGGLTPGAHVYLSSATGVSTPLTVPDSGVIEVGIAHPASLLIANTAVLYVVQPPATRLVSSTVGVRAGRALMRVACTSGDYCADRTVLEVAGRAHGKAFHRIVAAGNVRFAAGHTRWTAPRLTAFGRHLAAEAQHRKVEVSLVLTTTGGNRLVRRVRLR